MSANLTHDGIILDKTTDVVILPEGMTQAKREREDAKKAKREARKATNQAQKEACAEARDAERSLSHQHKRLRKYAGSYCLTLSLETGKGVSFDAIKALTFADFLPYMTEREDVAFGGSWTFNRFLTIVKRYFRAEAKNALTPEQIAEISAMVAEMHSEANAQ